MTTHGNVSINTGRAGSHTTNSQAHLQNATGSRLTAQAAAIKGSRYGNNRKGMIMHIRFTRAGYALAAGVAATAVLGLSAVAIASTSALAATNACGNKCIDLSFKVPGRSAIFAVHSGFNNYDNTIRLLQGSNSAYKEDFSAQTLSTVAPLYCTITGQAQPGSVFTSNQCALMKNAGLLLDQTYQLAYNPNNGGPGDLCVGAWNNDNPINARARLVTCGLAADTVLIAANKLPGGKIASPGYYWLINGGSSNYSNPVVATSAGDFPSDVRWQPVVFNGLKAIDTQEVRGKNGPF
jgi:hypothetical protein